MPQGLCPFKKVACVSIEEIFANFLDFQKKSWPYQVQTKARVVMINSILTQSSGEEEKNAYDPSF